MEEQGIDRGVVAAAIDFYHRFWDTANFLWVKVDERCVDDSYAKGAASFLTLSRGLGHWTTGRLSTYVKMLLLGLTVLFIALVWGWYGS